MKGSLKGDFSRFIFDPEDHFSGVQMQQGRVQLDSDWNAQLDILSHRIETGTTDLIGASGAPESDAGFHVRPISALAFDGQDDYLRLGESESLAIASNESFTIEAWVSPEPGGGVVISRFATLASETPPEGSYRLAIDPEGVVIFELAQPSGGIHGQAGADEAEQSREAATGVEKSDEGDESDEGSPVRPLLRLSSDRALAFGALAHLSVVCREASVKLFVDGRLAASGVRAIPAPDSATAAGPPCLIGATLLRDQPHHFLNGLLHELRLWRGARDETQLLSTMGSVLSAEAALAARWCFDQMMGERFVDHSGQGCHVELGSVAMACRPRLILADLEIGRGRYYVDGVQCRNEADTRYTRQPDLPGAKLPLAPGTYLVYVDVWDEFITAIQDPGLREVALGGPDTTTRSRILAQVKILPVPEVRWGSGEQALDQEWNRLEARAGNRGRARGRRCRPSGVNLGNLLYRVEIHHSGRAVAWPRASSADLTVVGVESVHPESSQIRLSTGDAGFRWARGVAVELFSDQSDEAERPGTLARVTGVEADGLLTLDCDLSLLADHTNLRVQPVATFKWSRDNGAVVYGIRKLQRSGPVLTLHDLGQGSRALRPGDWVEVVDDHYTLRQEAKPLCQVETVDGESRQVTLAQPPPEGVGEDPSLHPLLRRWDQQADAGPLIGGAALVEAGNWLNLEDGIQVCFDAEGTYRTGDYWWMPARTVTEEIEWPTDSDGPRDEPPHGIDHRYSPLAVLRIHEGGPTVLDRRRIFAPLITETTRVAEVAGVEEAVSHPDPRGVLILTRSTCPDGYRALGRVRVRMERPDWTPVESTPAMEAGEAHAVFLAGSIYVLDTVAGAVLQLDPQSETWYRSTSGRQRLEGRSGIGVAVVDDLIHVLGGRERDGKLLADHDIYDPAKDRWIEEPSAGSPSPESVEDEGLAARLGEAVTDARHHVQTDLATHPAWSRGQELIRATAEVGVAAIGGSIALAGGLEHHLTGERMSRDCWLYDPRTDRWVQLPRMREKRAAFQLVAVGRRLIALGGGAPGEELLTCEVLALPGGRWEGIASMGAPSRHFRAGLVHDRIHVLGGLQGDRPLRQHQVYDLGLDSWSAATDLNTPRHSFALSIIGHALHLIGGLDHLGKCGRRESSTVHQHLFLFTPLEGLEPDADHVPGGLGFDTQPGQERLFDLVSAEEWESSGESEEVTDDGPISEDFGLVVEPKPTSSLFRPSFRPSRRVMFALGLAFVILVVWLFWPVLPPVDHGLCVAPANGSIPTGLGTTAANADGLAGVWAPAHGERIPWREAGDDTAFVLVEATPENPCFASDWQGLERAGILHAPLVSFDADAPGEEQANTLIAQLEGLDQRGGLVSGLRAGLGQVRISLAAIAIWTDIRRYLANRKTLPVVVRLSDSVNPALRHPEGLAKRLDALVRAVEDTTGQAPKFLVDGEEWPRVWSDMAGYILDPESVFHRLENPSDGGGFVHQPDPVNPEDALRPVTTTSTESDLLEVARQAALRRRTSEPTPRTLPPADCVAVTNPPPGPVQIPEANVGSPYTYGFDASQFQGPIDWSEVLGAGVSFVYLRATVGSQATDLCFARNLTALEGVPGGQAIQRGAYHVFRDSEDPLPQVEHYLSIVGQLGTNGLAPMLDLERHEGISVRNRAQSIRNIRTWLEAVEQRTGERPIILTDPSFWSEVLGGTDTFAGYPLWIANYTDAPEPELPPAWTDWVMWQFSQSGGVPGITTRVDLDRRASDAQ